MTAFLLEPTFATVDMIVLTTLRGYRLIPLVWATLMPLAVATGYLRIAANKRTGCVVRNDRVRES